MGYQVSHLARLVDDLLDVSRITRGTIELRKERVDFKDIMQKAVETSRPLIDAVGHELSVTVPHRALYIEGDSVRLTQVIANLLNNAVKYTKGSGCIKLSAACEDTEVVVRVRDNGIGIVPQMLPRIFDLFAQADRSSTRAHNGLGLGLTLVKQLVELHGGHVEAKSQGLGHGSEFVVCLPLAEGDASVAHGSQPTAIDSPAPPHRILVVDDNSAAADTLAELLEAYGNNVQVAHDGQAALKAFEAYQPDVMLLDIGMPGMDGYEVARHVRQKSQADGVTLIAVTGWGQETDFQRSREVGIDHHLTKPLDLAKLRALLASFPQIHRYSRGSMATD
jgi:CheY-like chemotaxis protein